MNIAQKYKFQKREKMVFGVNLTPSGRGEKGEKRKHIKKIIKKNKKIPKENKLTMKNKLIG